MHCPGLPRTGAPAPNDDTKGTGMPVPFFVSACLRPLPPLTFATRSDMKGRSRV